MLVLVGSSRIHNLPGHGDLLLARELLARRQLREVVIGDGDGVRRSDVPTHVGMAPSSSRSSRNHHINGGDLLLRRRPEQLQAASRRSDRRIATRSSGAALIAALHGMQRGCAL